jgi:hypothetical protein
MPEMQTKNHEQILALLKQFNLDGRYRETDYFKHSYKLAKVEHRINELMLEFPHNRISN